MAGARSAGGSDTASSARRARDPDAGQRPAFALVDYPYYCSKVKTEDAADGSAARVLPCVSVSALMLVLVLGEGLYLLNSQFHLVLPHDCWDAGQGRRLRHVRRRRCAKPKPPRCARPPPHGGSSARQHESMRNTLTPLRFPCPPHLLADPPSISRHVTLMMTSLLLSPLHGGVAGTVEGGAGPRFDSPQPRPEDGSDLAAGAAGAAGADSLSIPSPESCLVRAGGQDCLLLTPACFPDELEADGGTSACFFGEGGSTGREASRGADGDGVGDNEVESTQVGGSGDAHGVGGAARAWSPADFLV